MLKFIKRPVLAERDERNTGTPLEPSNNISIKFENFRKMYGAEPRKLSVILNGRIRKGRFDFFRLLFDLRLRDKES